MLTYVELIFVPRLGAAVPLHTARLTGFSFLKVKCLQGLYQYALVMYLSFLGSEIERDIVIRPGEWELSDAAPDVIGERID